MKHNNSLSTRR